MTTRCYAWPLTVTADAELQLHVSTPFPAFAVRIFRVGAVIEEVAAPAGRYSGRDLPFGRPDDAWGWPCYSIGLDSALADGIYVAVPVPADGADGEVPADAALLTRSDACLFVVRRRPAPGRKIFYKLPTATYAAYNQLGGVSLYAGAHWVRDWSAQGYVVSLQRPGNGGVGGLVMAGDAPDAYARTSRRQVFAHWDAPFVAWLEQRGYALTCCTDFDLHDDEALLGEDALVLSAGHDEYWSSQMRRRILEFVDRGGNICFFAGDVACFEVEFAAAGDRLFCRKMNGGGPDGDGSGQIGALWHINDPEDWLTLSSGAFGGGWWDGRRAIDGYRAVNPAHWAFDGVEFPPGGITGGETTPVIGYETDGVRLERASSPPRQSEHRKGGGGGRALLALARLSAGWVAGPDQANAAMMIRTAPSGGMTFSVGTTDWPLALADGAVGRITENVVSKLASRSLMIHGPVCAEGEYIGEGEMVGAGQDARWYVDGGQANSLGLRDVRWHVAGAEVRDATDAGAPPDAGPDAGMITTRSAEADLWLTVTATATTADGQPCFGSRTVRVAGTEEYLRRRIVRALNALANPDEQGGALVDQHASEASLAERVIPVRLPWVRQYTETLSDLMDQLTAIWTANGRMAEGALRPDEI
jgi:hypothetical protein